MKHALLLLVTSNQFAGIDNENPYNHFTIFYKSCGTMGITREDEEVEYLRLFPFSLTGKEKNLVAVLSKLEFNQLRRCRKEVLDQILPTIKICWWQINKLCSFTRIRWAFMWSYKEIQISLWKCPNRGFDDVAQLNMFYSELRPQTKNNFGCLYRWHYDDKGCWRSNLNH